MKRILIVFTLILMFCLCLKPSFAWSSDNIWTNPGELHSVGGGALCEGVVIQMTNQALLKSVNKSPGADTLTCYVYRDIGKEFIALSNYSDNIAILNVGLNDTEIYHICNKANTNTYEGSTFVQPNVSVDFNVIYSFDYTNDWINWNPSHFGTAEIFNIVSQTYLAELTETRLFLNDNETSITIDNITTLNSTALINASAWIAVDINGTLSANDTVTSTNLTNLSIGLWNITAYFNGNSYFNSSYKTYWVNVTEYEPPLNITNYTYSICSDNNTLYNHYASFNNSSFIYSDNYLNCAYGCDNTTFNCNASPVNQAFYSFLIVLGIIIFVIIFDKIVLGGKR